MATDDQSGPLARALGDLAEAQQKVDETAVAKPAANDLSGRLEEAHRELAGLQKRVHQTAFNGHHHVTHLLERALTSLLTALDDINAHFRKSGQLDGHGQRVVSAMKKAFEDVETMADACGKALGELHVEVSTYHHTSTQ